MVSCFTWNRRRLGSRQLVSDASLTMPCIPVSASETEAGRASITSPWEVPYKIRALRLFQRTSTSRTTTAINPRIPDSEVREDDVDGASLTLVDAGLEAPPEEIGGGTKLAFQRGGGDAVIVLSGRHEGSVARLTALVLVALAIGLP